MCQAGALRLLWGPYIGWRGAARWGGRESMTDDGWGAGGPSISPQDEGGGHA